MQQQAAAEVPAATLPDLEAALRSVSALHATYRLQWPSVASTRPEVLVLGPARTAVSGVSTHVELLLRSMRLSCEFWLTHFQVGREGRAESRLGTLARLVASPIRLALEILRRRVALVHINTSMEPRAYWRDLAYLAVARVCGASVLYQVHGGALPLEFFSGSLFLTAFLRWTLRLPQAVVVLTSTEKAAYEAFVPQQKVVLVPNGIDCEAVARPRRRRVLGAVPLHLLYMGRLSRPKGIFDAIEALALLRHGRIPARLVVAGTGPEEKALRERVKALQLEDRVTFAGACFGWRKARLLAEADVLLLPTYHREGMPYALLEAMAVGVVPVVTRVGGIPDVAEDKVHALFVPPRNAEAIAHKLALLAGDRSGLARMSAACRERIVQTFSMQRVGGELRKLYAALCVRKR